MIYMPTGHSAKFLIPSDPTRFYDCRCGKKLVKFAAFDNYDSKIQEHLSQSFLYTQIATISIVKWDMSIGLSLIQDKVGISFQDHSISCESRKNIPMKNVILSTLLCMIVLLALGQSGMEHASIQLNSTLSYRILEPNQDLRKVRVLLEERANQPEMEHGLVLGSSLIALGNFQHSNTDSKFGYLMRHPTSKNQIGHTVSEAVLHSFQISSFAMLNSWITAYGEMLYDPQQSFGDGTITELGRNQIQLRKGMIVLGDLNQSPIYGAIGKMDVPFGLMGSVNPFTNSSMWHAFGGLSYGAQLSLKSDHWHATFMLAQGGAQFRALNTPVRDSTNIPSRLNNFVFDLNYQGNLLNNISARIGVSYLHGSAYCQSFPVEHFNPCTSRNPAATVYSELSTHRTLLKIAYAASLKKWPGTHNPNPPLDIYPANRVTSLSLGLQYQLATTGILDYYISAEFSNFRAGPNKSPWERQNQWVIGLHTSVSKTARIFVEIFRADGYTPLNFISGSAAFAPFPPGITHSENEVRTHGLVLGALVTI